VRWLLLLGLLGCGDNHEVDKLAVCRMGTATSASTIEDRYAVGEAAPYAAIGLVDREEAINGSIAERRKAAWQIVERVVAPVAIDEPTLEQNLGTPELPAWRTWYARDDFERTFKTQFRALTPDGRAARAPIDAELGFAANALALESDPAWTEQRFKDYVGAVDTVEKLNGLGGTPRVAYSPSAMGQFVESYAKEYACRLGTDPDPFSTDPIRAGSAESQHEEVDVAACELRVLGPVVAGAGGVSVTLHGDQQLYVRRGAPPTLDDYDCVADDECVVDGAGTYYAAVIGADAGHASVDIAYITEDVRDPACLDGEMKRDAVVVKADWRRQFPDETLPVFATDAATLSAALAGDALWTPTGAADPAPSDIFTIEVPSGARFRLPALHVMSKELDHWVWITLWYSTSPDDDFGADRPASITGPWRNYKMCVSTTYLERDPDPRGGQAGTLGDSLAAVSHANEATWCSNPYIEQGAGNAATNCIGCHQHGGSKLTAEQILLEPHHGNTRTRNNFFTDYLWVIKGGNGEDLSSIIQAELDFWDATDP
jgi:hypothetical protein